MAQVKAPEVEQPKKETARLIPEERLKEILNILLPYGYSHYDGNKYTGVSPFIGSTQNIITIIANDPKGWGSVFAICMERFTDEEDEENYGRTVSDILADVDLFRITEALAQYQLATGNFGEGTALSITSDVFDAFCDLVALGDGNCPECGAWLKCEPQYMTKGRTHDYPGDDIIYEYVYDCPVCDFHAVTSKDIYNSL